MTVFVTHHGGYILFQARAEGEGAVGDLNHRVLPGGSAFGKTYEEWAALPDGPYEV